MTTSTELLARLGVTLPVLAAPMAGGPTTTDLVAAAAAVGSLGFLAAGYKTAEAMTAEIAAVRATIPTFGVNVFAPNPVPVDPAEFQAYATAISPEITVHGLEPAATPTQDDDHWERKITALLADPVPVVSFTFGLPAPSVITDLQRAGTVVVQTVTTVIEAQRAAALGVDALAVQASVAGGHSGTSTPTESLSELTLVDLVAAVADRVDLPIFAAGGIVRPEQAAAAIRAGAVAVVVGTALLRTPESGTSAVHRAALLDGDRGTVITKAFTGRPARGLRNGFIDRHEAAAPYGYPALHHLTSPMRRASAAVGDPERVNLWAGSGYREIRDEPAGAVLRALAVEL